MTAMDRRQMAAPTGLSNRRFLAIENICLTCTRYFRLADVIADSRINITPVDFSQLSPWKLRDSRLFRFVHVIAVVVDVVVGIVGRTQQRTPFVFGTRHDFPIAAGSPTFAISHENIKQT